VVYKRVIIVQEVVSQSETMKALNPSSLNTLRVPNYQSVKKMVKALHIKVSYFRIISWDIGIDIKDDPIFIEYNVYNQSLKLHQITNGPIFGEFSDEILRIGKL
jgi:uncharacterized ubiquitin-like protein YukD